MRKLLSGLFLLAVLLLGSCIHVEYSWNSTYSIPKPVRFEVSKGMGAAALADSLEKIGLVKHPIYFRAYLKLNKLESKIHQGLYFFRDSTSIAAIAQTLTDPNFEKIKVTIPEGRNSWEIFDIISKPFPHLNRKIWDSLAHEESWAKELKLPSKSLEGYLFPATYSFPAKADEAYIQQLMVRTFAQTMASLDTVQSDNFKRYGLHGVLTLASIVEEESAVAKERKQISGVFSNRLTQRIPLGADPTVRYIFHNSDGPIFKSQLNVNDPYNTRKFAGLPPGPISNPGKASIEAALQPAPTDMIFFVAKDDGSREHFFAKTYDEHLRFCQAAAQNRKKRGMSETAEY